MESVTARVSPMWCQSYTSSDNVDHWTNQETWDAALSGIKVAISTYQVLYDALLHGFVNMGHLSLLIFDEGKHIERTPCTIGKSW